MVEEGPLLYIALSQHPYFILSPSCWCSSLLSLAPSDDYLDGNRLASFIASEATHGDLPNGLDRIQSVQLIKRTRPANWLFTTGNTSICGSTVWSPFTPLGSTPLLVLPIHTPSHYSPFQTSSYPLKGGHPKYS